MSLLDEYYEYICTHRRWYESFDCRALSERWEQLLGRQPESAICEAILRAELERYVDLVFPNEGISHGGPDFKCFQKTRDGQTHFYVEATCLTIESVTEQTHLPQRMSGALHYAKLTRRFRDECRAKSRQLADLDAPSLLAIATLHGPAGALCFNRASARLILTSETTITQKLDKETLEPVGELFLRTDMKKSAFQRPNKVETWIIEEASRSVSAILLCPFGGAGPYRIHGVLHPNPVRSFDAAMLPNMTFAKLQVDGDGGMTVIEVRHEVV